MITWRDLLEQMSVGDRVLDVRAEVLDLTSGVVRSSQMVVHPSEQEVLFGQPEQVLVGLAVSQKQHKTRMMSQIDVRKQTDLNSNENA